MRGTGSASGAVNTTVTGMAEDFLNIVDVTLSEGDWKVLRHSNVLSSLLSFAEGSDSDPDSYPGAGMWALEVI